MKNHTDRDSCLLAPKQAAKLLAISQRKLWSMTFREAPGIPHIRLGRCLRYPLSDLLRWIEEHKEGGKAQ